MKEKILILKSEISKDYKRLNNLFDKFEKAYNSFSETNDYSKDGAKSIVITLPKRFGNGLKQRASQYGEAWKRIGDAFPELEIWLVNCEQPYSYERTQWNQWLT